MFNIVIELEKENLNSLLESFGFNRKSYIVSKEDRENIGKQILQEIFLQPPKPALKVSLAAARGGRLAFFEMGDILYIEAFRNLQCISASGETFEFYGTLCKIEEVVKPFGFLRIHHSYLISLRHIQSASSCMVKMVNGKEIHVGRSYQAEYREALRNFSCLKLN